MKASRYTSLISRPNCESDLSLLAEQTIRNAGAAGVLPTPIDELVKAAKVTEIACVENLNIGFIETLKMGARDAFKELMQKIRGIADLRERVIYIPVSENQSRTFFPKAHELGHQVIPWHKIDPTYLDDDTTLKPDVEVEFEQEANFFASEVIFQGKRFGKHARDYAVSFDAVFQLSLIYGASKQATIWRYVEEQDEAIAVAQYYPSNALDPEGKKVLSLWKIIPSTKFKGKYNDIVPPQRIHTGHPWVAARDLGCFCDGNELLCCGSENHSFEWHAWWNGYTLFVLLRRRPTLRIIGNISKYYKTHADLAVQKT